MELQLDEIKEKVDQYTLLSRELDRIKNDLDNLKGFFEACAEDNLEDTKNKTVEFYGSSNNKVIVQNVETVKPIAWSVLKNVLGSTFDDFVKEEVKYTAKDNCKIFLNNIVQGNYIEDNIVSLVDRMTTDPKKRKTLLKQLKGKYAQDKKKIMTHTDLLEKEASDYAYLVNEVMAYEQIKMIIEASQFKGNVDEAANKIKSAVIVDEVIKVTLDCQD